MTYNLIKMQRATSPLAKVEDEAVKVVPHTLDTVPLLYGVFVVNAINFLLSYSHNYYASLVLIAVTEPPPAP
jgi:uncharacterized membrane protein SirB2